MKKKMIFAAVAAVAIVSGIMGYFSLRNTQSPSALALANIEALSKGEDNGCEETCYRAYLTASCYKPNGDWHSMRIVKVVEYKRESCVEVCYHDCVTNCPPGTFEK